MHASAYAHRSDTSKACETPVRSNVESGNTRLLPTKSENDIKSKVMDYFNSQGLLTPTGRFVGLNKGRSFRVERSLTDPL
jgi:hypothetical protein